MNNQNIAIIGGAGFIGSRLAKQLEEKQINFVILDKNKSLAYPEKWRFCDVTKLETLIPVLQDVEIIINLAAEHKDNVHPINLYYKVNVEGAKNVCLAAEQLGIKHIVFTSSVAVYGFVEQETDESGEYRPFNDYGKSKLDAEHVYDAWQEKQKSERTLVTIRPTVVFGENNRGNVYNLFRQIASGKFLMIGKGDNKKSMAYVENVAAFIAHATTFNPGRHIINYVDKPDFSMNELTTVICDCLKRREPKLAMPYILGLAGGYCFDFLSKVSGKEFPVSSIRIKKFCARTQFKSSNIERYNFTAPVSLERGIEQTVKYEFSK